MANSEAQRAIRSTGVLRVVFGLVCLALLLLALGVYLVSTMFSSATERTPGTVVDMVSNGKGLVPLVGYTVAGKSYTQRSELYGSFSSFRVGDQVTILYEPNNPQHSEIEGYQVGSFVALLLGIIGLVFGVVTVILVVVNFLLRRRQR